MFQSYDIKSDKTFGQRHLPALRAELKARGLDGFLIPHADEYQNEYLPPRGERLQWLTGFAGSAGFAIVLTDKAALFVDGRYTIQAAEQTDMDLFEQRHLVSEPPHQWIGSKLSAGQKIGYDPWLFTIGQVEQFASACKAAGAELVACATNPIDVAWEGQPDWPETPVVPHDVKYAGESSESKRLRIGEELSKRGADASVLTQPASLGWMFNVRGGDVAHSPLPLGRAVLHKDGTAELFINEAKISDALLTHLGNSVHVKSEAEFAAALAQLGADNKTVEADPASAPAWVFARLSEAGAKSKRHDDPCILPRAQKNKTEQEGARACHIRDGAAIAKFLAWLETDAPKGALDEIEASKKLEAFRVEGGELKDISFTTISAAGPNAALPHYSVDTGSNRKLEDGGIYLVDSGGQYLDGTTDITRTVAVGTPSAEMKDRFTRVLKGHIALSMCRFPAGTSGGQIDILARHALWQGGFDFDHGTGHGVGSYLGVHEGPQSISGAPKAATVALREGMILSNEPGYYKEGHYGIRIENLMIVTPAEKIKGGDRPMHGFETVTLAPIDLNLIEPALMSEDEITWLNAYHARVRETIGKDLQGETKVWLENATRPI